MADEALVKAMLGGSASEPSLEAEPDHAPEGGGDEGLEAAASDLLVAVEAKDPKGIASAIRAAVEMCKYDKE